MICIDRATFAHGHVVGRIKTGGADVTDCSRVAPLTVQQITGAKGIAVVFNQPEVMLITERLDARQVKGVAQGVGHHYRLGSSGKSRIQLGDIDIVGG
jgi:hypothetical protein